MATRFRLIVQRINYMNHQRFNIFNLIHKGLRNNLYDTALKIQRTDFSSVEETTPVIAQLEQLLFYFEEHARHEDTFVLPAIARHNPKIVREFESEHEEDHRLSQDMRAFVTQWRLEKMESPRVIWGKRIFYSFNRFVAFNLKHTNKEEELLNPILWENYSDEELETISQKIIQSIKPDILMAQSRWMMRSINRKEAIGWLSGVKRNAPNEIFRLFIQMAQQELSESTWNEVKTTLLEEPVRLI
jgi:hypothetical protein